MKNVKVEDTLFVSALNTIECEHTIDEPLMVCGVISGIGQVVKKFPDVYSVSGDLSVLSAAYRNIVWIKPVPIGRSAKVLVKRRPHDSMPAVARGALDLQVV